MPKDYKGKTNYTLEPNTPYFPKPYCFFPSKQSKKDTRELKTTLSSSLFPHKAQATPPIVDQLLESHKSCKFKLLEKLFV